MKATVLGASGGIGQPLSLLLKMSPLITELALYDIKGTPGVSADLSHITTDSQVSGYLPENDGLEQALEDADIVLVPAGVPRQPGMTSRDDLFRLNAGIVHELAQGIAQWAPGAVVMVVTNPVNSTLPIVAEVLKRAGVFDPARVFGVTTLDVVRAETFVRPYRANKDKNSVGTVPVVGGHSNETIVPLFSQAVPALTALPAGEDLLRLTGRVQRGGEEVVQAKGGFGSATLSMAFAAFRLADKVLRALSGEEGLVEPTFLAIGGIPDGDRAVARIGGGVEYFSVPIEFGTCGARRVHDPLLLDRINQYERGLLEECIPELKKQIAKGVAFAQRQQHGVAQTVVPVVPRKEVMPVVPRKEPIVPWLALVPETKASEIVVSVREVLVDK